MAEALGDSRRRPDRPAIAPPALPAFLTVHDPDDRPVYFRFYDPRVLRPFLDASTRKEVAELFGPCQALGVAAPEPGAALLLIR